MRPWVISNRKWSYQGKLFRCEDIEATSPDSGVKGIFERLHFSHWVNTIALTKDKNVVMVKQWRHGNQLATIELPGGAVDKGETDHMIAAQRELREETGYEAQNWQLLGELMPNPAFMANTCQTYFATDAKKVGELCLDSLEEIEVIEIPLADIPRLIFQPAYAHALIVAGFGLLLAKWPELFRP